MLLYGYHYQIVHLHYKSYLSTLAGIVLGSRLGAASVGIYIVLGLIGVPIFTSGGGPGYILQPTFGI